MVEAAVKRVQIMGARMEAEVAVQAAAAEQAVGKARRWLMVEPGRRGTRRGATTCFRAKPTRMVEAVVEAMVEAAVKRVQMMGARMEMAV